MTTETPERWRQIVALFDEAVKLAPERRAEYLASACGGDADLHCRVIELLEASGQAADFLKRPVVSHPAEFLGRIVDAQDPSSAPETDDPLHSTPTQSLASENPSPRTLGPYVLSQKIGEGGMGEVYLAEQREPIRRKVALKVIKAGMDTKQVVARFEAERQALALMDHPAIAKVFDAGETPDHRPYFVMEYVAGVPITEHCDRQTLTMRGRLELFLQVCDGVQHAHQKAVIHRDLKPSNVLVSFQDGRATPRIIDFGVAKAVSQRLTERTFFTELGVMIGTPEYMSPEQAEMTGQDVDTRTDVYSLGVMLYELLVGALPFDSKELRQAGYDEIRRRIREEDPPRPSMKLSSLGDGTAESARRRGTEPRALQRELRGDLDWIAMHALEKDRSRRYGSPADLAQDIRRHLNDEPVLAHAPTAAYRTRKFVRRHRVGVAAITLVAAALATGSIASTMAMIRARRAEAQTRQELLAKERVVDLLKDQLEVSEPGYPKYFGVQANETLDKVASTLDEQNWNQLKASFLSSVASAHLRPGQYTQAEALFNKALDILRVPLGPEPCASGIRNNLAVAYLLDGKYREAESSLLTALEIERRMLGPEHPDTLSSMYNLACVAALSGDVRKGMRWLHEAIDHGFSQSDGMAKDYSLTSLHGAEFDSLVERARRNAAALHAPASR